MEIRDGLVRTELLLSATDDQLVHRQVTIAHTPYARQQVDLAEASDRRWKG